MNDSPSDSPLPPSGLPELASILDAFREPAILLDPNYRIVAANRAYRDSYNSEGPLHGRLCYEISHRSAVPCDQAGEQCPLRDTLTSGQPCRVLHIHHTPRGEEHVDVETLPVHNAAGEIVYLIEFMRPTTGSSPQPSERGLVGRSPAFNNMLAMISRAAPSSAAVLLLGESGTGKEVVAHTLHEQSARAQGPFVPVECSGLTETLFESELFGHEKGSFTGAHNRKLGLVEAARGGTLFLDEVADIPLPMQVKLLRLLETGTFRRVGGVEVLQTDFRLICATNRGLTSMVKNGEFREDLYYRISVFPIHLPPLRERREDLPLLISTLLQRLNPQRQPKIAPAALAALSGYDFPGNIRELRNILERAALLTDGDAILPEHLPPECRPGGTLVHRPQDNDILPLATVEQRYLAGLMARDDLDKRTLANKLGVSERTLYRKLQALKA